MDLRLKNELITMGGKPYLNGQRFFEFFPHACKCGHTSKNETEAPYIGKMDTKRGSWLYMFNCPKCKTTFSKKSKKVL